MKILTFSGATPAEALRRAQEDVGEEAMLIETRELQKKSLGKSALYEIVVGIEEHLYKPKKRQHKKNFGTESLKEKSNEVLFNISEAAKQISQISGSRLLRRLAAEVCFALPFSLTLRQPK